VRWGDILRIQSLTVSLLSKKVAADQLFRHVVEGAAGCLAADEASLMLLNDDELGVVAATGGRQDRGTWREPVPLGQGVAGLVAQTGKPVLLDEGDDLTRFPNLAPKGGRIRSAMSVPLEVGGRVVGVLNANRLPGKESFTPEDLTVLRLFADTAALAIDQTNLLQRTQARSRALETLLALTEAFAVGLEPIPALAGLVPRLGAVLQPGCVLAFLGIGADQSLHLVAAWTPVHGVRTDGLGAARLVPTAELGQALLDPAPTWRDGLPVQDLPKEWGPIPQRVLVVPVAARETPSRCVLALAWDQPGFVIPSEDMRVLGALSRQVGLALSRQDRASVAGTLELEMAEARAHLVEVERLATIGQSMAGLVHDINAPLAALSTFAQLIQKDSAEAPSRERAGQILEAARRAQRLVKELLTIARPQPPTYEAVDLNTLLRSAMELERPQSSAAGYRLTADLAPNLPRVTADPHRLGQVFTNLLVNARQAMDSAEEGHSITVRTQRQGDTVVVRVEDDGPGIPSALQAKIFDWFFTTKPPGEGTGLGLAVSREILVAHGGNLRVEDTPGGGASFVLELPVTERAPD
jgi:signal transduction histidine kinase